MEDTWRQHLPEGLGQISTTLSIGIGPFLMLLVLFWFYQTHQKKARIQRFMEKFDGPRGDWFIGHVRHFTLDEAYFRTLYKWTEDYNGIFKLHLFGSDVLVLAEPDSLAAIMKTPGPKDEDAYSFISQWLGQGLATSNGPHWFRTRRLLTPAFHFEILKSYADVIHQTTTTLIEKWKDACAGKSASFEMFEHFSLMTLETLMKTAFSSDVTLQGIRNKHPYIDAVSTITQSIFDRMNSLLLRSDFIFYNLTLQGYATKKALHLAKTFTKDILKERRKAKLESKERKEGKYHDFVDMLLDAKDEDGHGLSDEEISDEVDTFMFAGHDTTASGLSWLMYNLARHPEHQERCRAEINEVLAGKDTIPWSDLPKLEYLTMCIRESLRMHSPITAIARSATDDFKLPDGRIVPKGVSMWLLLFGVHYNPAVWENPNEYDPYRFSPENTQSRHSHAYVPFSAGPRNCIGQNFAMNELKIVASQVLNHFQVDIDPANIPQRKNSLVLRTQDGLWLKLTPL